MDSQYARAHLCVAALHCVTYPNLICLNANCPLSQAAATLLLLLLQNGLTRERHIHVMCLVVLTGPPEHRTLANQPNGKGVVVLLYCKVCVCVPVRVSLCLRSANRLVVLFCVNRQSVVGNLGPPLLLTLSPFLPCALLEDQ